VEDLAISLKVLRVGDLPLIRLALDGVKGEDGTPLPPTYLSLGFINDATAAALEPQVSHRNATSPPLSFHKHILSLPAQCKFTSIYYCTRNATTNEKKKNCCDRSVAYPVIKSDVVADEQNI
jgi:hypothetical protein